MFRIWWLGLVGVFWVCVDCKRDTPLDRQTDDGVSTSSATLSNAVSSAGLSTSEVGGAVAVPPTSFDGAPVVPVSDSGLTGCVVRGVPGWAEVRCQEKNTEGGKLLAAHIERGAQPGAVVDIRPNADGTLTLVLPWLPAQRADVRFEWVDMIQELRLAVRGSRFSRVLPERQAEQCERFAKSSEQILAAIRAKIGPLSPAITPADVYRFPTLGECQLAGKSAWALSLEKLAASGEGANRAVVAMLALNHIDALGVVASAAYGPFEFAPEGLQLPPLMTYDYDSDGEAEVIIRQDILSRAVRAMTSPLPSIAAVFSFKQGRVAPYPPMDNLTGGGIVAEQLEPDGRPDVGDYGPFLAWLPAKCGRGECPQRIAGPRFFRRSLSNGGFSMQDDQVEQVIRNKCERTPRELVVQVRSASGKRQTAQNIACARVRGDSTEAILAQLNELKSEMCDDGQATCPLYVALAAWARATPPRAVVLPADG